MAKTTRGHEAKDPNEEKEKITLLTATNTIPKKVERDSFFRMPR
jgi:hypothetical protein